MKTNKQTRTAGKQHSHLSDETAKYRSLKLTSARGEFTHCLVRLRHSSLQEIGRSEHFPASQWTRTTSWEGENKLHRSR